MREWQLNETGFVMNYMIAGPMVTAYETAIQDKNQLQFEKKVRQEIVSEKPKSTNSNIRIGEFSDCGKEWSIYYSYGNWFIDCSAFYSTLKKISMEAATSLIVKEDMTLKAVLWTYMSVGIYCNGTLIGEQKYPVYKPIKKLEVILPLKKGKNIIKLVCETLGVRDTRNIVGLQILDRQDEVTVCLPDEIYNDEVFRAEEFLNSIRLENDKLSFPVEPVKDSMFSYQNHSEDYLDMKKEPIWNEITGKRHILLNSMNSHCAVRVKIGEKYLERKFERTENIRPQFSKYPDSKENNCREIYERIAEIYSFQRGERFGFGICNVLAREYLKQNLIINEEILYDTIRLINKRVDCSDFILCGLIRYIHNYEMTEDLKQKTKEALLGYRYWMDMKGTDGMCFWSENHALMFYTCAMQAGGMYPDDYFELAEMTGKELHEYGRKKVLEWLEDVEKYGFEEFLSTVYMCVTFAALLNVIDFSEEEISTRATKITDKMLEMLSLQVFKGAIVAPMGRVYREVLFPFAQGAQAMMNLINPSVPYSIGEGWLAFLATSKYQIPNHLCELMDENIEKSYTTGNARIVLEKNEDYCITSVQSPRESEYVRWPNIINKEDADKNTHEYNKSFNECFHGTTFFAPGVYGYQQHMAYIALDSEAVIFINHPGATTEASGMRPGYWNGNGIMPAIKQEHGKIGMIFSIPENYPIHFIHMYCPINRFENVDKEAQWIFLEKGTGYIAVWCSEKMKAYDGMMSGCEQRVYADDAAYFCCCGKQSEYKSFEAFKRAVKQMNPMYDNEKKELKTNTGFTIKYEYYDDNTQYLD